MGENVGEEGVVHLQVAPRNPRPLAQHREPARVTTARVTDRPREEEGDDADVTDVIEGTEEGMTGKKSK